MLNRWPHGDPRDVARSIVADARYHVHAETRAPQATWLDAVRAWLGQVLRGVLHTLDRAFGQNNPAEAAIGFILIALAFGFLGFGVYALARSYLRGKRAQHPRSNVDPVVAAVEQSATALRVAALAAARAGRYRDAAALLFLSAVRALDEGGRIAYDPARTPGEYRRLVRDPLFDAFASDAVVALFAAAEPRDDLFERMSALYDRFLGPRPR